MRNRWERDREGEKAITLHVIAQRVDLMVNPSNSNRPLCVIPGGSIIKHTAGVLWGF